MPSTYSARLRLELQADGENTSTWGQITNVNLGTLLEESIAGVAAVSMTTDTNYTLTANNGATDEARRAVLQITSTVSLTATRDVTVPTASKLYVVYNNTTGGQSLVIKTSGGSGITVPNGAKMLVYCDGTNVVNMLTYLPANTVVTASITDANVTYAKIQNVAALSVFGRASNSAGVGADITAGTDGHVLRRSGTSLGFGTLASDAFADNTIVAARLSASAGSRLFGRHTGSAGAGEEVTLAADLEFNSGALRVGAFTGDITKTAGSLATTIATSFVTGKTADAAPDMAADYLLSYDDSATAYKKVLMRYIGAGKQVFWVDASSIAPRASNGCAALATLETTTNKVNYDHLAHDASTAEYHQFKWKAPKSIGTATISAIPVWSHPSTATNFGVVWGLQALGRGDADAMEVAFGTAQEVTDTGGTTDTLYIGPETAAITVGGSYAAEDLIVFQGYRNATSGSDTLAVDARLHGWLIIVTTTQNTEQ